MMRSPDESELSSGHTVYPQSLAEKFVASFIVRCRSTRGGPWGAQTEFEVITAWVKEALDQCAILNRYATTSDLLRRYTAEWIEESRERVALIGDVTEGDAIVDLVGNTVVFLEPNRQETRELAAWGLVSSGYRY